MRFSESQSSLKLGDGGSHSGYVPVTRSSHRPTALKTLAGLPLLSLLFILVLPLPSIGQTSREIAAENHIQAAKQAQTEGDYAQAATEYEAAVKLMPEVPELYGNLGIAYYLQKDYAKAIEVLNQALKRKPSQAGPSLYLGMAYIRLSRFAESIKPLQRAISLNPKQREAYINLSASYNELEKDEESLQVLQQAAKVFPDDQDILYALGTTYYDLMFKTYGKMARVAPNSFRYDQVLGKSFEERQEFGNAIVEYKLALKANPQATGLHYALGNVYWLSGKYDDAKPEFEAELQIAPEDYLSTWKLGNIYLHKRDFDQAQVYLHEAIQQKPNLAQAYRDLGKVYMETHDYDRAVSTFQKLVQIDPTVANAHFLLATAYRHIGNAAGLESEMAQFSKLSTAEYERRRPSDDVLKGGGQQSDDLKPVNTDDQ